jgi:hypothetical protein
MLKEILYRGPELDLAQKTQEDYARENGFTEEVEKFPNGSTFRKITPKGLFILNILKKSNEYLVENCFHGRESLSTDFKYSKKSSLRY